jgi:hypothetical protein
LITNNPGKAAELEELGITITEHVAMPAAETPHNVRYLATKRERLGHHLIGAGVPSLDTTGFPGAEAIKRPARGGRSAARTSPRQS